MAGRDGRDAVSPTVRGTWRADADYRSLDIVARDGGCFIAKRATFGVCPGPDWQIVSTRGARGERGERGPKGERGPAGPAAPTIVGWQIDRASFTATPIMSDGSEGPPLDCAACSSSTNRNTMMPPCRFAVSASKRGLSFALPRCMSNALAERARRRARLPVCGPALSD